MTVYYPVTRIFRSIQGEGHFVGYPMIFVRLAGCSVKGCAIRAKCDEAPWKASTTMNAEDVVARVRHISPHGIVCITGGEPTDHDLVPLLSALRETHRVHLETSGQRSIEGLPFDWITVSPKTLDYRQREGHTLKVVVSPGDRDRDRTVDAGWGRVLVLDQGSSFLHRYLQPLTEHDGSTNLELVVAMLLHPSNSDGRWALSTQAHKTWRVD